MTFNLSPKVRLTIYLATGLGTLVVGYLSVKHIIGDAEVALWAGVSTLVNGLSAVNTNTEE